MGELSVAERDWIVGLGEVLWDVFPDAACFGGAPANFACHARALGAAHTAMVSAVGPTTDPLAEKAIDELRAHGLDTRWIQRNSNQTGRVFVEIDALGQPSYRFAAQPAWDWIDWSADLADLASQTALAHWRSGTPIRARRSIIFCSKSHGLPGVFLM
jgi:fructokinase